MADMILLGTGGHLYCIFYDHCFLCRNGNLFCLYLAFLCGFVRISCIWKMVLQEKYGPHPQVGAGKHCYYMYCRCSYYGSVLHPGVYGAAANEERDLDYVIVLGARVKEHTVSNSLKRGWIRPLNMQRKIGKPIWCCQEAKDWMNLYQKPRPCTGIWCTMV